MPFIEGAILRALYETQRTFSPKGPSVQKSFDKEGWRRKKKARKASRKSKKKNR